MTTVIAPKGRPALSAERRAEQFWRKYVIRTPFPDDPLGSRLNHVLAGSYCLVEYYHRKGLSQKTGKVVELVGPMEKPAVTEERDFCWLYRPSKTIRTYGNFRDTPKTTMKAHDYAYYVVTGRKIQSPKEGGHRCGIEACVRADKDPLVSHIEPQTHPTNIDARDNSDRTSVAPVADSVAPSEAENKSLLASNGFRKRKSDGVFVDIQGRPVDLWHLLTPEGHQKLWEKNHPHSRKASEPYTPEEIEAQRYHDPARRPVKHDIGDEEPRKCDFTGCANPQYVVRVWALGPNGEPHWKEVDEFLGGEFSPHSCDPHYEAFDCLSVGAGEEERGKVAVVTDSTKASDFWAESTNNPIAATPRQPSSFVERTLRRIIPEHYRLLERLAMTQEEEEAIERYDADYELHRLPKARDVEVVEEGREGVNRKV